MGAITGLHVVVDGAVNNVKVYSESHLRELMVQLVDDLNMQIIDGPRFKHVDLDPSKLHSEAFEDEGGLSGYCMISTSHISIHVWPLRNIFMMDIFSCATFDIQVAEATIRKFLNPLSISIRSMLREPEAQTLPMAG